MNSKSERAKQNLERYSHALREAAKGNFQPAVEAIQLGELPHDSLIAGCVARLRSEYVWFRGYGPRRRVKRALLQEAFDCLKDNGVRDILPPAQPMVEVSPATPYSPANAIRFALEWHLEKCERAASEENLPLKSNLHLLRRDLEEIIQKLEAK